MQFGSIVPLLCIVAFTIVFQIAVVVPKAAWVEGTGRWTRATTDCSKKTPTLATGQTWVQNTNCTNGTTFNTNNGTTHCHCWSHCGYICGPRNVSTNGTSTSTTTRAPVTVTTARPANVTTTTAASTCKRKPTLQAGETLVNSPGCSNGTTFDPTPTTHCHCWEFCAYICGPKPLSTTAATTG